MRYITDLILVKIARALYWLKLIDFIDFIWLIEIFDVKGLTPHLYERSDPGQGGERRRGLKGARAGKSGGRKCC